MIPGIKDIYHRMLKERPVSSDFSEEEAGTLMENRTKFKLYAAERHLDNLRMLEQKGSNMRIFKDRICWEMEIESFLFHIAGVWDSLLYKINNNWKLKLVGRGVKIESIKIMLNYLNEQTLLEHLEKFNNNTKKLREWRNRVTHENLINVRFDAVTSGEPDVYFIGQNEAVIPLLQSELQNVKGLIRDLENDEPRLV